MAPKRTASRRAKARPTGRPAPWVRMAPAANTSAASRWYGRAPSQLTPSSCTCSRNAAARPARASAPHRADSGHSGSPSAQARSPSQSPASRESGTAPSSSRFARTNRPVATRRRAASSARPGAGGAPAPERSHSARTRFHARSPASIELVHWTPNPTGFSATKSQTDSASAAARSRRRPASSTAPCASATHCSPRPTAHASRGSSPGAGGSARDGAHEANRPSFTGSSCQSVPRRSGRATGKTWPNTAIRPHAASSARAIARSASPGRCRSSAPRRDAGVQGARHGRGRASSRASVAAPSQPRTDRSRSRDGASGGATRLRAARAARRAAAPSRRAGGIRVARNP